MEKLTLRFNEPALCALARVDGKEVPSAYNGTEVMFTLVDGRVLYAPPALADAIEALRPRRGEQIELTKTKVAGEVTYFARSLAEKSAGRPAPVSAQAPVAVAARPAANALDEHFQDTARSAPIPASTPLGTQMSKRLLGSLLCAINACHEAETYSARLGRPLQFSSEDVRCFAITAMIQNSKEGGVL